MSEHSEQPLRLFDLFRHINPLLRFMFRKWYLLIVAILLGTGLGLAYYFIQKPKYKGVCTFVLEEKQAGLGGLGSLASQFGFDIGSLSGGGSLYAGENIFEILKSKKIIYSVLLSIVDSSKSKQTLADFYIEFTKLRKSWKQNEPIVSVSFEKADSRLSLMQDTVLNLIYEKIINKNLIVDKVGKKGNLIKVETQSENRLFANLLSQRIVEEAKDLYIFIKVGNAQKNINNLQRKADSLQNLLNGKTFIAAQTQVIDGNPGLVSLRVPTEIAVRDKTVIATLYGEIVKNLEASKMILAQQTPVIQIIDYPDQSAKDNLKSKQMLIIIGAIAMLFLFFVWMSVQYIINVNTKTSMQ
jgi:hypothetical protein